MKDIQSQPDGRGIAIRKVGVKNISYPITVLDKANRVQHTVASINMYVNLPHHFKGTHMSRFIEILNRCHGAIDLKSFHAILQEMKERLSAEASHLEIGFPYFLSAPAKGSPGRSNGILCRMHGSLGQEDIFSLTVELPIAPPPSRQASGQMPRSLGRWGLAEITVSFRQFMWIEDIIHLADATIASCRKMADCPGCLSRETRLTVEEVTRALADLLACQDAIRRFHVRVVNLAAGYDTFAEIEWPDGGGSHLLNLGEIDE